jgi:hypothetical protein
MGSVYNITWDTRKNPIASLLFIIIIKFNKYKGPDFLEYKPGILLVFPVIWSFKYKGSTYSYI